MISWNGPAGAGSQLSRLASLVGSSLWRYMSSEPSSLRCRFERLPSVKRSSGLETKNPAVEYIVSDQNACTGTGKSLAGKCATYRVALPLSGTPWRSVVATG